MSKKTTLLTALALVASSLTQVPALATSYPLDGPWTFDDMLSAEQEVQAIIDVECPPQGIYVVTCYNSYTADRAPEIYFRLLSFEYSQFHIISIDTDTKNGKNTIEYYFNSENSFEKYNSKPVMEYDDQGNFLGAHYNGVTYFHRPVKLYIYQSEEGHEFYPTTDGINIEESLASPHHRILYSGEVSTNEESLLLLDQKGTMEIDPVSFAPAYIQKVFFYFEDESGGKHAYSTHISTCHEGGEICSMQYFNKDPYPFLVNKPTYGEGYTDGYNAGQTDGYGSGFSDGYEQGTGDGYDSGYTDGKNDGTQSGYDSGYQDGEAQGYNEGYGNGFRDGEGQGYNNGYRDGENQGFGFGYDNGYWDGRNEGYYCGFEDGRANGYQMGHEDGSAEGYQSGLADGRLEGYRDGIGDGMMDGYRAGYDAGFQAGYNLGLEAGASQNNNSGAGNENPDTGEQGNNDQINSSPLDNPSDTDTTTVTNTTSSTTADALPLSNTALASQEKENATLSVSGKIRPLAPKSPDTGEAGHEYTPDNQKSEADFPWWLGAIIVLNVFVLVWLFSPDFQKKARKNRKKGLTNSQKCDKMRTV